MMADRLDGSRSCILTIIGIATLSFSVSRLERRNVLHLSTLKLLIFTTFDRTWGVHAWALRSGVH